MIWFAASKFQVSTDVNATGVLQRSFDGRTPDPPPVISPVGDDASRMSAIPISEGFNLGYCRAKPGKGPMMHNHDTNETFIPMTGVWRCSWENEKGEVETVDLNPLGYLVSARSDPALREYPTSRVRRRRGSHVRHRRQRFKGRVHRQGDEGTGRAGRLAAEVTRCVIGDCREAASFALFDDYGIRAEALDCDFLR